MAKTNSKSRTFALKATALRADALQQIEALNIRREKDGLYVDRKDGEHYLVGKFRVHGLGKLNGIADGAIISARGRDGISRRAHVPYAALQDHKKLGSILARIGLTPPISAADLKLIARYIDIMSRLAACVLVIREGISWVDVAGVSTPIAVYGDKVIAPSGMTVVPIAQSESVYSRAGTFKRWQRDMAVLLKGNPLVITPLMMAIGTTFGVLFGLDVTSLIYVGDTSEGKSLTGRILLSSYTYQEKLTQWNGTPSGIEGDALRHYGTAMVRDELGTAAAEKLSDTIYMLNGRRSKPRADGTGGLQPGSMIETSVFATGELAAAEHAGTAGSRLRGGHDVRLPTIWIDGDAQIFQTLADGCADTAQMAQMAEIACKANYGHLLPNFAEAVIENHDRLKAKLPELVARSAKRIAKTISGELSKSERRVLKGFVTLDVAGRFAVAKSLLPLKKEEVTEAVSTVFKLWLTRQRETPQTGPNAAVNAVVDWTVRCAMSTLIPLNMWRMPGGRQPAGYRHEHDKHGPLLLVHCQYMEDVILKGHDARRALAKLKEMGLLTTGKHGLKWLQHMPGTKRSEKDSRMPFYALSESILFQHQQ